MAKSTEDGVFACEKLWDMDAFPLIEKKKSRLVCETLTMPPAATKSQKSYF